MKLALVLIGLCALAAADAVDDTFYKHQTQVLHLVEHIYEPISSHYEDLIYIKKTYDPLQHLDLFKDGEQVKHFVHDVTHGKFLAHDEIFNIFHPQHRRQMIYLFEILYGAKDFDTFFNMAVWARDHMSPRMFLYAFSVAVLHRADCKGITLPPAYEITPDMFLTTDVMRKAYQAKMTAQKTVIPMKFTGSIKNPEQRVAYFGEDIGINSHHSHWHMDFPFWWKRSYDITKDRRGELFFYMHHQMVNRFDAERLSNFLPQVEPLDWHHEIEEGFAPAAMYFNGQEFPMRPDGMHFHDLPWFTVKDTEEYEDRIRDIIAKGYVKAKDGHVVFLNGTEGIDVLGLVVESLDHDFNSHYFGRLHLNAHVLLSKITDPEQKFGTPPGVMEHFETATRDPAFFRLHKHIDNLFKMHKEMLSPYTKEELDFPGVIVDAVKVVGKSEDSTANQIVTFFDESHINLGNMWAHTPEKVGIEVTTKRLNHESFKYVITATADKDTEGIVRIFLSPTYNWFGQEITLQDGHWGVIEMDRFPVKLTAGENVITRSGKKSVVTIDEPMSFAEIHKAVADKDATHFHKEFRHCGFPHRLLVPKGRPEGMHYKLMVVITDYHKDVVVPDMDVEHMDKLQSVGYCGVMEGKIPDGKPMGFPFDRPVPCEETFITKNMKFVDITVKTRV
uniref:Hemocyanin subunit 2 n=1 Tax=Perla grandis TaxID=342899 RepID=Q07DS0_9NEOP|nr:hemocyanin subunit 2 [Perla grandis]